VAANAGFAGGSASGWGGGAKSDGFCGPRRRRVSATVVGVIRGGRGIGWTRVFLLSEFESVHGEGGMGTGEPHHDSEADRRVGATRVVRRAADGGRQRWSDGAVLPELFPGEWSSGLLGAPGAGRVRRRARAKARARARARALTTEATEGHRGRRSLSISHEITD